MTMDHNESANPRRDFLKKAGTVAWAVPAISAVNMTGALAGGDVVTSVTDPTKPPTTRPMPPCTCSLRILGRDAVGRTVVVRVQVVLNDDCGHDPDAVILFHPQLNQRIRIPFQMGTNFPVQFNGPPFGSVPVAVVDAQDNVLALCTLELGNR